jgi:hypothetical protein
MVLALLLALSRLNWLLPLVPTLSPSPSPSPHADFCRSCGTKEVYDYKDASVVADVVKAVKAASPPHHVGIYDAILEKDSFQITIHILEMLGSGNLATVILVPNNVPRHQRRIRSEASAILSVVNNQFNKILALALN